MERTNHPGGILCGLLENLDVVGAVYREDAAEGAADEDIVGFGFWCWWSTIAGHLF